MKPFENLTVSLAGAPNVPKMTLNNRSSNITHTGGLYTLNFRTLYFTINFFKIIAFFTFNLWPNYCIVNLLFLHLKFQH